MKNTASKKFSQFSKNDIFAFLRLPSYIVAGCSAAPSSANVSQARSFSLDSDSEGNFGRF